jgi:hypothetical protein
MAGLKWSGKLSEITTGTTKKTVMQILAPTNQVVLVKEWGISFQGIDPVATPILVELVRQSDAGSGGDALTLVKADPDRSETIQSSALSNIDDSTQPTETAVLDSIYVPANSGFRWIAGFGEEILVDGGGRLGIAVTAAAAVDCTPYMKAEE